MMILSVPDNGVFQIVISKSSKQEQSFEKEVKESLHGVKESSPDSSP